MRCVYDPTYTRDGALWSRHLCLQPLGPQLGLLGKSQRHHSWQEVPVSPAPAQGAGVGGRAAPTLSLGALWLGDPPPLPHPQLGGSLERASPASWPRALAGDLQAPGPPAGLAPLSQLSRPLLSEPLSPQGQDPGTTSYLPLFPTANLLGLPTPLGTGRCSLTGYHLLGTACSHVPGTHRCFL